METQETQDALEDGAPAMHSSQAMQTHAAAADGHARVASTEPLLSSVIVPRTTSTREIAVLETAMQGLALDRRHPVALELAATATSRQWLLRATSAMARLHLHDQVQARYPQAYIQAVPNTEDPLVVRAGEMVVARELRAGAAAYLPLRNWRERELLQEGADPLLGILAVFNHLPAQMRVVAHLALVPASPTWSHAYRRKAVEHPLDMERLRTRRDMSQSGGPSTPQLVGMGILVAILLLWWRFQRQLAASIPSWVLQAALSLVHGQMPRLTSVQQIELALAGAGILAVIVCLGFIFLSITRRIGTTPIYDMRLVGEKTARPAYRVRLRLFVFVVAPDLDADAVQPSSTPALARVLHTRCWHAWRQSSLVEAYQRWRERVQVRTHYRRLCAEVLDQLGAAYRQYHTAAGGYFVPHTLSSANTHRLLAPPPPQPRLFAPRRGWNADLRRSSHLLSVADVAALWHLPQAHDVADLAYVERGRARTLLAPAILTQHAGWRLGTSSHAGQCLPVFLPEECLRHNLLAVASTGKGKSTLFQHLAAAIFAARATVGPERPGFSLAFLEPHGDVIAALLGRIPDRERDHVVLVDLANADYPVGLNPLDMVGKDRDKVVDNLITIAEHLWEASYGSRTENVLEYALKTLADVNEWLVESDPQHGPDRQYTLLDVVALLRQTSFRHALFEQVRDPLLLDWWQHYYEPMDARQQREVTSSVITKLSKFSSSRRARRILGQPRSTLDLNAIIRAGQLLLVSTASGVVGADLSELIGIVLLGLFESALAEQASVSPEKRSRYLVLIDEFQVYRGANYQMMLAELRKYGGSFGLATQSLSYLDRLDQTLRATVLANIDHLFAFHMAGEDARLLHELDDIAADDITNLDDFQCYVKLSLAGRRLPVFSLNLDAPPPHTETDEARARSMRLRSQQRDARPVGVADDLIHQSRVRQQQTLNAPRPTKRRGTAAPKAGEQREPDVAAAALDESTTTGAPTPTPTRKQHKRGGSSHKPPPEMGPPAYRHVMYDEAHPLSESEHREPGEEPTEHV